MSITQNALITNKVQKGFPQLPKPTQLDNLSNPDNVKEFMTSTHGSPKDIR